MSPPRMRRPSREMPSVSERDRDDTLAIAATPSAMQARKMPKPLQAAAQFAQGEAQDERQGERGCAALGVAGRVPCMNRSFKPTAEAASASIWPERRRTVRSQSRGEVQIVGHEDQGRAAVALEREEQVDDGARPVVSSRLPVGSSATRMAGFGTMARAIATRCCSPPESCAG